MAEAPSILWIGKSGQKYRFWIYSYNKQFPAKPGNFIVCTMLANGWKPVFIGHTQDLSKCIEEIQEIDCVEKSFPTHIHAHFNPDSEEQRLEEAKDIWLHWGSECQTK